MSWKRPPARTKQYEGANPAAPRATVVVPSASAGLEFGCEPRCLPARPMLKAAPLAGGQRIRDSARGEDCTVRLDGVCTFDPAKTIWSHARWGAQLGDAGRGMATKALDLCGAYACTACDAAYDGQLKVPHLTRDQIDMAWLLGHLRSLGVLHRKGLL